MGALVPTVDMSRERDMNGTVCDGAQTMKRLRAHKEERLALLCSAGFLRGGCRPRPRLSGRSASVQSMASPPHLLAAPQPEVRGDNSTRDYS